MSEVTPQTPHFVHSFELVTRWGDMDALQHVNNSLYLVYLQEARLDWIKTLSDRPKQESDAHMLVASSEINYRRPIIWPATIRIEMYCDRIGNSSATLSYRLVNAEDPDMLYAECRTVMVWVDPQALRPTPIPDSIRAALKGQA